MRMPSASSTADSQIQAEVLAELAGDVGTLSSQIAVAVRDGVVTLDGEVDSLARRLAVVRAAERVRGVRALVDQIIVRLSAEHRLTDVDLASAVVQALIWDTEAPDKTIKVRVQDHWVWLVGDSDFEFQRAAAQRAVEHITGVKGVTNLVRIKKRAAPPELQQQIERALARDAKLARREIDVLIETGRATLTGTVGSWRERQRAEEVASTPPGVDAVDNLLELDP
jgi:osmotically-inducible protein OsmY